MSGRARPLTTGALIVVSTAGAALLIAPLHWLALRAWRRAAGGRTDVTTLTVDR